MSELVTHHESRMSDSSRFNPEGRVKVIVYSIVARSVRFPIASLSAFLVEACDVVLMEPGPNKLGSTTMFPMTSARLQLLLQRKQNNTSTSTSSSAFPMTSARLEALLRKKREMSSVSSVSSIAPPVHSNFPTLGAFPFSSNSRNNPGSVCSVNETRNINLAAMRNTTGNPRGLRSGHQAPASVCGGIVDKATKLTTTSVRRSPRITSSVKRLQTNHKFDSNSLYMSKRAKSNEKQSAAKSSLGRQSRRSSIDTKSNCSTSVARRNHPPEASKKSATTKATVNSKDVEVAVKSGGAKGRAKPSLSSTVLSVGKRTVSGKRPETINRTTKKQSVKKVTSNGGRQEKMGQKYEDGCNKSTLGPLRYLNSPRLSETLMSLGNASHDCINNDSLLASLTETCRSLRGLEKPSVDVSPKKLAGKVSKAADTKGIRASSKSGNSNEAFSKGSKVQVKRLQSGRNPVLGEKKGRPESKKETKAVAINNLRAAKNKKSQRTSPSAKANNANGPNTKAVKAARSSGAQRSGANPNLSVSRAKSRIPVRTKGTNFDWREAILRRETTQSIRPTVSTAVKKRSHGAKTTKDKNVRRSNGSTKENKSANWKGTDMGEKNGPGWATKYHKEKDNDRHTAREPSTPCESGMTEINGEEGQSTSRRTARCVQRIPGVRHSPRQSIAATSEKISASFQSPKLYRVIPKDCSESTLQSKTIYGSSQSICSSPKKQGESSTKGSLHSTTLNAHVEKPVQSEEVFKVPLPFSQHNIESAPKGAKILANWIPMLKSSQLRIEGHLIENGNRVSKNDMDLWKSSVIVKRDSKVSLKTKSGGIYVLQGTMDTKRATECLVPPFVIKEFKNGFPPHWVRVLGQWMDWKRSLSSNLSVASFTSDISVVPFLNSSNTKTATSIVERGSKRKSNIDNRNKNKGNGTVQAPATKRKKTSSKLAETIDELSEEEGEEDVDDDDYFPSSTSSKTTTTRLKRKIKPAKRPQGGKTKVMGNDDFIDDDHTEQRVNQSATQHQTTSATGFEHEHRLNTITSLGCPSLSKSHSLSMRARRLKSTRPELHAEFDTSLTLQEQSRPPLRLISPTISSSNKRVEMINERVSKKAPLNYFVGYNDFIASQSSQ